MNDARVLDEADLRLVNFLQIAPRASWADAGRILHAPPASLAARWRRLEAAGTAWLSAYPNPAATSWSTAFLEIDVRGVALPREESLRRLCAHRAIIGVSETDQLRAVIATVFSSDEYPLQRLLLDELPNLLPGVDATARIAVRVLAEGTDWRLDALTDAEQRAAARLVRPMVAHASTRDDAALIAALIDAPRAPVHALAAVAGLHPSTAHRRIERLLGGRHVRLRCDLAPRVAGWHIEHTWFLDPPSLPPERVAHVRAMRELRFAATLTGDAPLAVTGLSRTLADARALEDRILAIMPDARVQRRILHMRTHKRMGRVLDAHERPVREAALLSP